MSKSFKLQWRKFTLCILLKYISEWCVSNSSGENLHSVRNSIFLGYEYWSLYSCSLNLYKRQRLFKVKHRICGVLQISAKALSVYLQNSNRKLIARFNGAKVVAVLPRCHSASHYLASLLRADKPAIRHRQTFTHVQSHPAATLPYPQSQRP